jgi:hypothetical protein
MRNLPRQGTSLLVLAAALSGAGLAWSGWTRLMKPAPKPTARALVMAPTEESEILSQRLRAKNRIVERLLAGELNLLEAAAWFRHLEDNPLWLRVDFRSANPGRSDGEKACRQVIRWVSKRLAGQMPTSQAELVLCQLQAELDTLLADSDTVELPW